MKNGKSRIILLAVTVGFSLSCSYQGSFHSLDVESFRDRPTGKWHHYSTFEHWTLETSSDGKTHYIMKPQNLKGTKIPASEVKGTSPIPLTVDTLTNEKFNHNTLSREPPDRWKLSFKKISPRPDPEPIAVEFDVHRDAPAYEYMDRVKAIATNTSNGRTYWLGDYFVTPVGESDDVQSALDDFVRRHRATDTKND